MNVIIKCILFDPKHKNYTLLAFHYLFDKRRKQNNFGFSIKSRQLLMRVFFNKKLFSFKKFINR